LTAIAPFKITQDQRFWYRSKSRCDFLLVNNTNLFYLHHFRVIAAYCQIITFNRGVSI